MSALLNGFGIRTYTIAKHRGTADAPRAHVTNQRTMEIFRDMGIEERVLAISVPLTDIGSWVVATSLTGMEIGRYSAYGKGDHQLSDFAMSSPCRMESSPQNFLEPVLLGKAREMGADVRFFHELVHIEQSSDGVFARVRERTTQAEYIVRARYAIGADGARSVVAQQAGFNFQGEPGLMSMVTGWLEVDLSSYTAYRPGCIYWLLQPGNANWVGSGTCICVRPFDEWTLNWQYDPTEGDPDMSEEGVIAYARQALGLKDESLPIRVKHVSKWQVNHVVATEYRRERIFLAGDAAHRHPPPSGLGSNTSVQDAYNLAWKLALVLKKQAGERILDSYNQERQPVGKQVVDHAIGTLYEMTQLAKVLGFEKGQSQKQGYASLKELFSDVSGAEERRKNLAEQINLGNRRSNAMGLYMGQRYTESCAIVDDGTPFPLHQRDAVLYYEPTTHPGAYLPHAWVQYKNQRVSTLEILEHGRFGLIVGIGGEPWQSAAAEVTQELEFELPVYPIGYRCAYDDVTGEWSTRREIGDRGALLVRPDRHIAWRYANRPGDPRAALRSALLTVLGRDVLRKAP
jgi:2,4-dichlorophenol 6-monooxygenase